MTHAAPSLTARRSARGMELVRPVGLFARDCIRIQDDTACRGCGYGLGIGDPVWRDRVTGEVYCAASCGVTDPTWPD